LIDWRTEAEARAELAVKNEESLDLWRVSIRVRKRQARALTELPSMSVAPPAALPIASC
jgi:hypothetical protein